MAWGGRHKQVLWGVGGKGQREIFFLEGGKQLLEKKEREEASLSLVSFPSLNILLHHLMIYAYCLLFVVGIKSHRSTHDHFA